MVIGCQAKFAYSTNVLLDLDIDGICTLSTMQLLT